MLGRWKTQGPKAIPGMKLEGTDWSTNVSPAHIVAKQLKMRVHEPNPASASMKLHRMRLLEPWHVNTCNKSFVSHVSKEKLVCPLKGYISPTLFPTLFCISYIQCQLLSIRHIHYLN